MLDMTTLPPFVNAVEGCLMMALKFYELGRLSLGQAAEVAATRSVLSWMCWASTAYRWRMIRPMNWRAKSHGENVGAYHTFISPSARNESFFSCRSKPGGLTQQ